MGFFVLYVLFLFYLRFTFCLFLCNFVDVDGHEASGSLCGLLVVCRVGSCFCGWEFAS